MGLPFKLGARGGLAKCFQRGIKNKRMQKERRISGRLASFGGPARGLLNGWTMKLENGWMAKLAKSDGGAPGRQPLLAFENVTLRVGGRLILPDTTWRINRGQQWVVLGPNGAGKSTLMGAVAGRIPVVAGRIQRFYSGDCGQRIGYVSFDLQRKFLQRDADRDDARYFRGDFNGGTLAGQLVFFEGKAGGKSKEGLEVVRGLQIEHLMDRKIRALSTGEMRKMLIARALVGNPILLILDEPFDGLDSNARQGLGDTVDGLMENGLSVILVTHRFEEIPAGASHVLGLKNGRVVVNDRRSALSGTAWINRLYGAPAPSSSRPAAIASDPLAPAVGGGDQALVEMRRVSVRYGPLKVIDNLDWTIRKAENWAVVGPNGSGKTTLVKMICGDHPQAYANEIFLFGRRRGSGESIWDIKEKIGLVSFEFQVAYRADISALSVVVSGFYDSIGIYRIAGADQKKAAYACMAGLGIGALAQEPFAHLSQGEQRMVLLARAMVKRPLLLALDEPCQGLDPLNRRMVLDLVDAIGGQAQTQILLVTHYENEILPCISHILRLKEGAATVLPAGRFQSVTDVGR